MTAALNNCLRCGAVIRIVPGAPIGRDLDGEPHRGDRCRPVRVHAEPRRLDRYERFVVDRRLAALVRR